MKAPPSIANYALTGHGIPTQVLGAVLAAVVLAHALVLQVAGDALGVSGKTVMRPFVTRAVAVSVAAPQPATGLAPSTVTAASVTPSARSPKPSKPRPRPVDTPNAGTAMVATSPVETTTSSSALFEENQAVALVDQAQTAPEKVALESPEKASPAAVPTASEAVAPAAAPAAPPAPAKPPVAVVALTLPGSVRLLYNTVALDKGIHWNVNGELLWLQDGVTYDARLEYSLFNLRKVYSSKGRISSEGLLPARFGDKFRSSEVAAHFERDKQKVIFSANTPEVPLLPGMQDQLSVFLQLGAMFAGAPGKYPAGTQLSFETIGARHPDTWVFEVQGEEKLSLPGGEVQTIKLVRAARREFDRSDELWLAPKLGYLPVRIKLSERNGDFIDQQWRATETP